MNDVLATAVSGLMDASLRLSTAAKNIANAQSSGRLPASAGDQATSYTPQDVVTLSNDVGDAHLGVHSLVEDRTPSYEPAYDPTSPNANADGLVAAPNVDIASEMVKTIMASEAYKANAAVIKTALENDKKLMDSLT